MFRENSQKLNIYADTVKKLSIAKMFLARILNVINAVYHVSPKSTIL